MKTQSTVRESATSRIRIRHLGPGQRVFIHGYARAVDFDASMPIFRRINDWFSFDRGYDFKPGKGSSALFSFGGVGRGAIIGGAVGLLVGVGSYLFRLMSQSGSTKSAASVDDNTQFDSYLNRQNAE